MLGTTDDIDLHPGGGPHLLQAQICVVMADSACWLTGYVQLLIL